MSADLFAHDGRLTDISLERYALGELHPAEVEAVREHLAAHPDEAARLDHILAEQAAFDARPLPSFLHPAEAPAAQRVPAQPPLVDHVPLPQPANSPWWRKAAAPLALAAGLLLTVGVLRGPGSPDDDDGVRLRGSGLELRVHRATPTGSVPLRTGERVAPGDLLGFQVLDSTGGHLVVAGLDATGEAYAVHPTRGGRSVELAPAHQPRDLGAAIQLDPAGSWERLVAVRCESSFEAGEVLSALRAIGVVPPDAALPELLPGCAQTDVVLLKGDDL